MVRCCGVWCVSARSICRLRPDSVVHSLCGGFVCQKHPGHYFVHDTARNCRFGYNNSMKVEKYVVLFTLVRLGIYPRARYGGIFSLVGCCLNLVAVRNCTMLRCLARVCPLARSLSAIVVHMPFYFSQVAGYGCTCSLSCVTVLNDTMRWCLARWYTPSRSPLRENAAVYLGCWIRLYPISLSCFGCQCD